VISSAQEPRPDNTHHSQEKDLRAPDSQEKDLRAPAEFETTIPAKERET